MERTLPISNISQPFSQDGNPLLTPDEIKTEPDIKTEPMEHDTLWEPRVLGTAVPVPTSCKTKRKRRNRSKPFHLKKMKFWQWLCKHLEDADIPGLTWSNKKENIFKIDWQHAASSNFQSDSSENGLPRQDTPTVRENQGNSLENTRNL